MAVRNVVPVDRLAAALRTRLTGRNLQMTPHGAVHKTRDVRWMHGETIPGPACGTATGELNPTQWSPTRAAITCLRCHRIHDVTGATPMVQLALFDAA